jgi:hypothetical protein
MATARRTTAARAGLGLAAIVIGGCNAVLGIHEPFDLDGSVSIDATGPTPRPDAMRTPDGGPTPADAAAFSQHRWADWPMPNPPSSMLPNPQSYDTTRTPGVVFDRITKLAWQRTVPDGVFTWTDALAFCTSLDLAGGSWRLPSRIELLSILDFTQPGPVIDPKAFPNTPGVPFWTASPDARDASAAWSVHFGFGTVFANPTDITSELRVRCVR